MIDGSPTIISIAERPELHPRLEPIMFAAWDDFMLNDPVGNRLWGKLFTIFPDYQFVLLDEARDSSRCLDDIGEVELVRPHGGSGTRGARSLG